MARLVFITNPFESRSEAVEKNAGQHSEKLRALYGLLRGTPVMYPRLAFDLRRKKCNKDSVSEMAEGECKPIHSFPV